MGKQRTEREQIIFFLNLSSASRYSYFLSEIEFASQIEKAALSEREKFKITSLFNDENDDVNNICFGKRIMTTLNDHFVFT